jgi:hypothetical protein
MYNHATTSAGKVRNSSLSIGEPREHGSVTAGIDFAYLEERK